MKLNKKLGLSKETIRSLSEDETSSIEGAGTNPYLICRDAFPTLKFTCTKVLPTLQRNLGCLSIGVPCPG